MIEDMLKEIGTELPEPSVPGGNYCSFNIRGCMAYIAIQFPILNGDYLYRGELGKELNTEDGYKAMQLCALNVLAQINKNISLNRLDGINHLDAYYRAAEGWDDAPDVVNGASDLLIKTLGDRGTHSRSIVGVKDLPKGFSFGLTASITLKKSIPWLSLKLTP